MINNTIMLYLMTIAKIIFPLITLPYLTRILSVDNYGVVSFVKSYMVYIQLVVDFGFSLSSVKDIVEANNDKKSIGIITGSNNFSKANIVCYKFNCYFNTLSLYSIVGKQFVVYFTFFLCNSFI